MGDVKTTQDASPKDLTEKSETIVLRKQAITCWSQKWPGLK